MRKFILPFIAVIAMCFMSTSCLFIKPYDRPEYVNVGTNETAFVIDLFAPDSQENSQTKVTADTNYKKVNEKLVQIPHKWIKTGRLVSTGYYTPTLLVVSVSNSPVTGTWENEIKVETKGSQGFTVPMKYGIRVTPSNSEKFLSKFPANIQMQDGSTGKKLSKKMTSVENIANDQFKNEVAAELSKEFHKYEYKDVLPNRDTIVDAAVERVKAWAEEFGITIDNLAVYNGLIPDDPTLQNEMDEQAKLAAQVETEKKRQEAELQKKNNEIVLQQKETERVNAEKATRIAQANATVAEQQILAQTSTIELNRKQREQEIENLKLKGQAEAEAITLRAKSLSNIKLPTVVTSPDMKVMGLDGLISEAVKGSN